MSKTKLLLVDDDDGVRAVIAEFMSSKNFEVIEAARAEDCCRQFQIARPDLALIDYFLPDGNALDLIPRLKAIDALTPIIIMTGHGTVNLAVRAIKEGAEQFVTKPIELSVLRGLIAKALEDQRSRRKQLVSTAKRERYRYDPFLGKSKVIQRLENEARRILGTEAPILIHGETGTGKGVLARWLHENGPRADESIVDLNCAGFSRELLESELFGYEKGAFTGAVNNKPGLLEVAHRGTVFLDEIGDMDMTIQPKLLKVLEEKRLRRLGDLRDRNIDVVLLAATHQDLSKLVAESKFRSDLFFRVSTIPLWIPPLRERKEDIRMLAAYLLRQLQADLGRPAGELTPNALLALESYSWPGNIRELRNVLERALLLCKEGTIGAEDLIFQLPSKPALRTREDLDLDQLTLEQVEVRHIAAMLRLENGVIEKAAARLDISRSTLYSKIKLYNIKLLEN